MNAVDDTADTGTLKEALVDENDSILQRVTLFKMSELLSYVPEHLVWDTYKVFIFLRFKEPQPTMFLRRREEWSFL
eukprot:UN23061